MKRHVLLLALLGSAIWPGAAQAAGLKLRPQGQALTRAVQEALAQLSTKDVPMTLDTTSGPILTLGGVGASNVAFNPDVVARVVVVSGERRIEFNPQNSKVTSGLTEAVKQELMHEFNLKAWTPALAQLKFGGADLNGDSKVDLADLAILMGNYGVTSPAAGDLNQDRRVDDTDVRLFTSQYRVTPTTTSLTPGVFNSSSSSTLPSTGTSAGGTTDAGSSASSTTTPSTTRPASSPPGTSGSGGSAGSSRSISSPLSPGMRPLPTPPSNTAPIKTTP